MKNISRAFLYCFCLTSTSLLAGQAPADSAIASEETHRFPFEIDAEFTYATDESQVARGSREIHFDESYSFLRFVYTPRIMIGILRLGVAWERFGFSIPDNVQLEDTLQSVSAVIGLDTQFSDSILVRFEAQPGLYGSDDELDGDTFNVPFILGGTYIYSPNLQFVLGLSVDFERDYPVLPGGGIRWRMGPQWVLNAVLPTPRLEYEVNQTVTFYAGANVKSSTFRVDENFGSLHAGDARLNNAVLSYTEVRVGLGMEVKLSPEVKLSFEAGYVPYREFDYHRTDVRYHQEEGAPYASAAFHAAY